MPRPLRLEDIGKQLLEAAKAILLSYCSDAPPFSWILGSCYSPPDPFKLFRESIARAVQAGGVVVAPVGDVEDANQLPTEFQPGQFAKYAIAVGGVTLSPNNEIIPWAYTRPADYVDVAAFAGPVIGPSGKGDHLYNTFSSTVAAASIAAGVSSLIKAVRPDLSGEDIEEILRRTAKPIFGYPTPNLLTGYGVIDARAALELVVRHDIQRIKKRVDRILTNRAVPVSSYGQEWIYLKNYPLQYYPRAYCPYARHAYGKRYEFTAWIGFPQTFEQPPHVWVRWAESDGVDTRFKYVKGAPPFDTYIATYDPFWKDLTVVSVDRNGFTVKGRYWYVRFYDDLGRECTVPNYIPRRPEQFQIAYTAVGLLSTASPPQAPTNLRITNRGAAGAMPRLEWDASRGAEGYYVYRRCANNWRCQSFQRIAMTTGTSWIDSGVIQGTVQDAYTYQVTAYNAVGESAPSNQVSTYGAPFGPPYSLEVPADSLQLVQWVPEVFAVRMVGPQPFTHKTTLEVDLPEAVQVRLVVYDMLGREVARPVEGYYRAGRHRLQVVGADWPAGVYIYRLEAGRWLHSGTFVRQ